jgi:hypothetical protein
MMRRHVLAKSSSGGSIAGNGTASMRSSALGRRAGEHNDACVIAPLIRAFMIFSRKGLPVLVAIHLVFMAQVARHGGDATHFEHATPVSDPC